MKNKKIYLILQGVSIVDMKKPKKDNFRMGNISKYQSKIKLPRKIKKIMKNQVYYIYYFGSVYATKEAIRIYKKIMLRIPQAYRPNLLPIKVCNKETELKIIAENQYRTIWG